MELAATLLIVALAAAIVLRRAWRLFRSGGKAGCGVGCGSCPAARRKSSVKGLISLDVAAARRAPPGRH